MTADFLVRHPDHADTVADWIFDAWGDGTPEGRARAHARVQERLRDDAVPLTLVALDGEVPLGTVSLFTNDLAGWEHLTPWLAALYVTPEARGRGVGTRLIRAVLEVARDLGYETVYLQAQDARDFYAEAGWRAIDSLDTERGRTVVMEYDLRDLPRVFYRADADAEMGLGHVVHAARLDVALRSRGLAQLRLVGRVEASVACMLEDGGMSRHISIDDESHASDVLLEALSTHPCSVVAANLPKGLLERAEPLFARVRQAGHRQVHFDDPLRTAATADLVINSLPHIDWGVDLRAHPALHEGLEYFLLDPEFTRTGARVRDGRVETVLISMGGGDAPNLTAQVMDALDVAGYRGVAEVVIGAANRHLEAVAARAESLSYEVRLHQHLPSLADLASSADLAFSALGLTTYEFASLGLPAIILAGNELNAAVADIYAAQGSALSLGYHERWTPVTLAEEISSVLADGQLRRAMSVCGPQLVDGKGADRVCALLEPLLGKGTGV